MKSPLPFGPARSAFDGHVSKMRAFRASAILSKAFADKRFTNPLTGSHRRATFGELLSDLG
jgi:hypothetical protein